jgi:hypothetical protein
LSKKDKISNHYFLPFTEDLAALEVTAALVTFFPPVTVGCLVNLLTSEPAKSQTPNKKTLVLVVFIVFTSMVVFVIQQFLQHGGTQLVLITGTVKVMILDTIDLVLAQVFKNRLYKLINQLEQFQNKFSTNKKLIR